jgi:transposase-like protein
MISKKCNKCNEKKLLTEFHKGGDKYGLQYTCKSCKLQYSIQNKEKENKRKTEWILNNLEKIKKSKKKYYQSNKNKEIKRNTIYANNKKKK